jgi:hypothetical protein
VGFAASTFGFAAGGARDERDGLDDPRRWPAGTQWLRSRRTLPKGYRGLRTDILRDRVRGKWNVQAVIADAADADTMLAHTALQARLRGLV